MTGIAFALALQASVAAMGESSYALAYQEMQQSGRPMLILVGADWCPACRRMKDEILPRAQADGLLADVSLAVVNSDHDPRLAQLLMRGGSIPQLILYQKTASGWKRSQLTGAQSPTQISALLSGMRSPAERLAGESKPTDASQRRGS